METVVIYTVYTHQLNMYTKRKSNEIFMHGALKSILIWMKLNSNYR